MKRINELEKETQGNAGNENAFVSEYIAPLKEQVLALR